MPDPNSSAFAANTPNLFIIGAQKAGTTTMWDYLNRHPDVFMCQPKEPNHFTTRLYERAGYLGLFEAGSDVRYRGDASTTNSLCGIYPGVPEAIAALSPDARIVYAVRDPITRLESSWVQGRSQLNQDVGGFDESVRNDPRLLDGSRYWTQLQAYRRFFSDRSILVLFFEDLRLDPAGMSAALWDFLDLDPLPGHIGAIRANPSEGKTRVTLPGRVLQKTGIAALGRKLLPQSARQALRRALSRRIEQARWDPDTLAWAQHELADEARALLEFCGRPTDFWSLQPTWGVGAR